MGRSILVRGQFSETKTNAGGGGGICGCICLEIWQHTWGVDFSDVSCSRFEGGALSDLQKIQLFQSEGGSVFLFLAAGGCRDFPSRSCKDSLEAAAAARIAIANGQTKKHVRGAGFFCSPISTAVKI